MQPHFSWKEKIEWVCILFATSFSNPMKNSENSKKKCGDRNNIYSITYDTHFTSLSHCIYISVQVR